LGVPNADKRPVEIVTDHGHFGSEHQRRLAACLKACEGIPTEKLEDGIILRLVAACFHVDDKEVRAVLDELALHHPAGTPSRNPPKQRA
jgi:hypothetical protein